MCANLFAVEQRGACIPAQTPFCGRRSNQIAPGVWMRQPQPTLGRSLQLLQLNWVLGLRARCVRRAQRMHGARLTLGAAQVATVAPKSINPCV